jgi:hypothetical protein
MSLIGDRECAEVEGVVAMGIPPFELKLSVGMTPS